MEYLADDGWQQQYDLTFALYFEKAQCEWLNGDFDASESLLHQLITHAKNNRDRAQVYSVKIEIYRTKGEPDFAVETSIESLKLFGIHLSAHPSWKQVLAECEKIWKNLEGRQIEDLIDLPLTTNLEIQTVVSTLAALYAPAYVTDSNLVCLVPCLIVNISLEHGNTDASAVGYAAFGRLLVPKFSKYREGYQFGKLAYDLVEKYDLLVYKARICDLFGVSTTFWVQYINVGLEYAYIDFQAAVATGDVAYACFACMHIALFLLVKGEPLDEVYCESEKRLEFVNSARFHEVRDLIVSIQRLIQNLREDTSDKFADRAFEDSIQQLSFVKSWYYNLKCQSKFLFGNYREAVTAAEIAESLLEPTQLSYPECIYYAALSRASDYAEATRSQQKEYLEQLHIYQNKLRLWAENCPDNYLNKYALVAAEIARLEAKNQEAIEFYEQAIKSAREYNFVQNEGIANELAAKFYLSQGSETIANTYLQTAYTCYARWGAAAKIKDLQKQYPHAFVTSQSRNSTSTTEKTTSQELDLSSVIKASQAISEEIVLDKFLEKLMTVLMESAGARIGFFLLLQKQEWLVVAEGNVERENLVALPSIPLDLRPDLPSTIINYVAVTKELVVLNDATEEGIFTNEAYVIRNKPKSILCLPVIYHGKLKGILYLENNLAKGAFTDYRLDVLNLLSSQAAISLENASLYQDLQTYSEKLEQQNVELKAEIEERQHAESALQQSEERLRLAIESTGLGTWDWNLITGIIHLSDRFKVLSGVPPEAAAEADYEACLALVHPEDRERTNQIVQQALSPNSSGEYMTEYRIFRADGTVRWLAARGRVLTHNQQAYRFIGTVLDITESQLAQEQIQASLEEKVVLLKEIHHRVKNNLQIIISLLNLQSNRVKEPQTLKTLQECQNRVSSMALIHEQLYQSEDLAKIDFAEYAQNLVANLYSSYEIYEAAIQIKINIDNIYLNVDTAIPCGLIVNELVSNSLKYAFPLRRKGEISIDFYLENDDYFHLCVKDNGVGIPPEINTDKTTSLGLQLVKALTRQLQGTLILNRDMGTEFKIRFKNQKTK
jgi:PAS domain S-box-containing protein